MHAIAAKIPIKNKQYIHNITPTVSTDKSSKPVVLEIQIQLLSHAATQNLVVNQCYMPDKEIPIDSNFILATFVVIRLFMRNGSVCLDRIFYIFNEAPCNSAHVAWGSDGMIAR
jgi:hypothetical protein